jgi:hypothetical protein
MGERKIVTEKEGKSLEKLRDDLHKMSIEELLRVIKAGEATPQHLAVAHKFLTDAKLAPRASEKLIGMLSGVMMPDSLEKEIA